MGRQGVEKSKKLEVHVAFESSRVASECLAQAYERVVPITRRTIHPGSGSGQALEKNITQAKQDRTPDLVRGRLWRRVGGAQA